MSAGAARTAAYEVLRRTFEDEAWTDRAFRSAAARHELAGRDLALAQRLAYGAVQRRGTSDHLIGELARRAPERIDAPALAALRLGLYETLFAGGGADHAAVGEAVELAKGRDAGGRRAAAAGLVNAVLRRAVRERPALLAGLDDSTPQHGAVAHSYPEWMVRMWWEELGPEAARALMRAMNEPAETALRVTGAGRELPELCSALRAAGVDVARPGADGVTDPLLAPDDALVVRGPLGGAGVAALEAGEAVAQSRGSQAVVALLDPRPGERLLDLCAGPGIKATQAAARMAGSGRVDAVELDPGRARQIAELATRTAVSTVAVEVADARRADLGGGYDRALVDPPCTDLGTLASRPDARWRKSPRQPDELAGAQAEMLRRGGRALRPGGALVYSTCTVSRRENDDVVASVLESDPQLAADDLGAEHPALASVHDPRFLQLRPDRDATTGFFIARLRRRAA